VLVLGKVVLLQVCIFVYVVVYMLIYIIILFLSSLYVCMAIKHIIVLFVETPGKCSNKFTLFPQTKLLYTFSAVILVVTF
jgi:hypothetical protein